MRPWPRSRSGGCSALSRARYAPETACRVSWPRSVPTPTSSMPRSSRVPGHGPFTLRRVPARPAESTHGHRRSPPPPLCPPARVGIEIFEHQECCPLRRTERAARPRTHPRLNHQQPRCWTNVHLLSTAQRPPLRPPHVVVGDWGGSLIKINLGADRPPTPPASCRTANRPGESAHRLSSPGPSRL